MSESRYLKSVWLELRGCGLENVPHWQSNQFARFAERHGLSPYSPARQARIDLILAKYAERALLEDEPLAQVFVFPLEPVAAVFDLRTERLRRRGAL